MRKAFMFIWFQLLVTHKKKNVRLCHCYWLSQLHNNILFTHWAKGKTTTLFYNYLQSLESMVLEWKNRVDASRNVESDYGIVRAILLHKLVHGRSKFDLLTIVLASFVPLDSFQCIVHVRAPYDHQWSSALRHPYLSTEYLRSSWMLFNHHHK